jgi:hypothetical protein
VTDNLDFDRILDICLDQLRTGATVANCLTSYPQHATQLAPLLQVASLLETPSGPEMSAEGLRAGEARLLAQAARLRTRRKASALPLTGLVRRLAAAGIAGAILVCGMLSAGTVSAASLPGSPLYPIKQATEAVVAWAAFTPQLQTTVHLAWADRRLDEAEALMARDGTADASVLAALERETGQALTAAEQSGPEQLAAVAAQTERQQTVLQAVLDKAPAAARPGLERALGASAGDHARAESALDRAAPGKSAGEQPTNTPTSQATPSQTATRYPTDTPTSQATPSQTATEYPTDTPTSQVTPTKPTEEPPTGTPPGQAGKDQPTPTEEEEQVTATPSPVVTNSPEPTPTVGGEAGQPSGGQVVSATPTPDQGNGQGQGNDKEKKDKEKKDKKPKKDK